MELNEDGTYKEDGDYRIPGVSATGTEIKIAFVDPAGSMTDKLFPSGLRQQLLDIKPPPNLMQIGLFQARVSLVDSANPFVFVDAAYISSQLRAVPLPEDQRVLVEAIRQSGAVAMGMAPSLEIAAKTRGTPKIALLEAPFARGKNSSDIRIVAYSMGLPHPTLQLSGAVCVASGLMCDGTILSDLSSRPIVEDGAPITPERTPSPLGIDGQETRSVGTAAGLCRPRHERAVVIEHSQGTIEAHVVVEGERGAEEIKSCAVSRTARRLFEGNVRYFTSEN